MPHLLRVLMVDDTGEAMRRRAFKDQQSREMPSQKPGPEEEWTSEHSLQQPAVLDFFGNYR